MRSLNLFVYLCLCLSTHSVYAMGQRPPTHPYVGIRVAVLENEKEVSLTIKGPYRLERRYTHELIQEGEDFKGTFFPSASGLLLGQEETGLPGVRLLPLQQRLIRIDGRRFRGMVEVVRQSDNTLP